MDVPEGSICLMAAWNVFDFELSIQYKTYDFESIKFY
jgi:hypothetical protein